MGGSSNSAYQPTGQAAADQTAQAGLSTLSSAGSALYGQANAGYTQAYNAVNANPYAATAQAGANQVASDGQAVAASQFGDAASLNTLGSQAAALAPAVEQTGFDPQSALYNRNLTSTLDSANVAAAQSGLAGSPFAAGVAGQTAENFNLDWANNQQARQASAVSQLGALSTTAAGDYSGASTLGNQGLNTIAQSSALPSETYLAQQNADISALNALVNGTNTSLQETQNATTDADSYLTVGQNATSVSNSAAQANAAQTSSSLSGITSGLTSLFDL